MPADVGCGLGGISPHMPADAVCGLGGISPHMPALIEKIFLLFRPLYYTLFRMICQVLFGFFIKMRELPAEKLFFLGISEKTCRESFTNEKFYDIMKYSRFFLETENIKP